MNISQDVWDQHSAMTDELTGWVWAPYTFFSSLIQFHLSALAFAVIVLYSACMVSCLRCWIMVDSR